jgi:predicted oxidoreductase
MTIKTYRIPGTDLEIPRIAYGCAEIISREAEIGPDTIALASERINAACGAGIALFDLAAMYKFGKVEAVFGAVLRHSPGLRDRIILQTKCGAALNPAASTGPDPVLGQTGEAPFLFDTSRKGLLASVDGSLQRLGTDHVDILLLHWPDRLGHPEEIASAFDTLHAAGKVRHFGVSNHTAAQIALLRRYVRQPLVINQIRLSLTDAYPITAGLEPLQYWNVKLPQGHASFADVLDYCRLHAIQVQAYSPLRGIARYKLADPPEDAPPQIKEGARVLAEVAKAKSTTPTILALAWLLHHPAHIVPVIGGRDPRHIAENCAADQIELTDAEWYRLLFAAAGVGGGEC